MRSLEELQEIHKKTFNQVNLRKDHKDSSTSTHRAHVLICGGTGCTSSGSNAILEEFEKQIKSNGLESEIKLVKTGCFGLCALGPVVVVYPEGAFYSRVNVEDVAEIVTEHLLNGRIVKKLLYF